jgi:oligosaccharide 4-alpha-D-glucosyltransferase
MLAAAFSKQHNEIMKLTASASLALCLAASPLAFAQNADRHYLGMKQTDGGVEISTSDGRYLIRPYAPEIVETTFVPSKEQPQAGSHAVVLAPGAVGLAVRESAGSIELATSGIVVTVEKSPFRIAYAYKGKPLVAEKQGYGHAGELESIEFALDGGEALYGAGSRAVGMNRRGHRFRCTTRRPTVSAPRRADGLWHPDGAVFAQVRAPLR